MPRAKKITISTEDVAPKKRVAAPKKRVSSQRFRSNVVCSSQSNSIPIDSSSSSSSESLSEFPLPSSAGEKRSRPAKINPNNDEDVRRTPGILSRIASTNDRNHVLSTLSSASKGSKTTANNIDVRSSTMMKMSSVIAMTHFADVTFFSFKIEKLAKSEETLSTSLL
jgi:hypothetical protein